MSGLKASELFTKSNPYQEESRKVESLKEHEGVLTLKDIIYDIVISVLIMALLTLTVIPLFRNNMDIIATSAEKISYSSKIGYNPLQPATKGEVAGSDVVSAIRYYSEKPDVEIIVTTLAGGTKKYLLEPYVSSSFEIPYEATFSANYSYLGTSIVKAMYIEQNK